MSLRISHLTFDAHDANAQAHWWAEALGWSEDPEDPNLPGHEECMIFAPDGRQRLLFIEVGDDKVVKNRLHLDLVPTDVSREAEVERLVGAGRDPVADHRRAGRHGLDHAGRPGGQRALRAHERARPAGPVRAPACAEARA